MFNEASGEQCLSRTFCYEWYKHFKSNLHQGWCTNFRRQSIATDVDHVERVQEAIRVTRRLTVCEVGAGLNIIV